MGTVLGLASTPAWCDWATWPTAFASMGALALLPVLFCATVVTQPRLRPPAPVTTKVTPSAPDSAQAQQGSAATQQGEQRGASAEPRGWRKLPPLFALAWAHSAIGWGFFTFQNWIPTYLQSLNVGGPGTLGLLSALPWAATAIMTFATGRAFETLRRSGWSAFRAQTVAHTCACLGASAVLLPMALQPAGPALSIACMGGALALQTCNYAGFHAYVQTCGAHRAGAVLGVTNSCGIVTGIAANEVLGQAVASSGSYAAMFGVTAVVYASSWVFWVLCLRGKPLGV